MRANEDDGEKDETMSGVGRGCGARYVRVGASWRSGWGPQYVYVTRKFWVALSLNGGRDVEPLVGTRATLRRRLR